MYSKAIISIVILVSLWNCVSEIDISKPSNPALLVTQIRFVLANNPKQLKKLMLDKEDLISTLTADNNHTVYAYEAKLFTIATRAEIYNKYSSELIESYKSIKEKPLNWQSIQIQKVNYETDSLQINIKGLLIVKDSKYKLDSIHFKGVKILNNWCLTAIYN